MPLLSIIVPAFNEHRTIGQVLQRIAELDLPVAREVIVVDDGSTDETLRAAQTEADRHDFIRVVRMARNGGKGAAIRHGATLASGDILVIQDADNEVDPGEYVQMLVPMLRDGADVVYGSRFLGRPWRWQMGYVANRFLTGMTNVLFGGRLTDMETSHKMMRTDVFRQLVLTGDRFEIEPEITSKILRSGHHIHEVPIAYEPRTHADGKKIGWRDGVVAIRTLARIRLTPRNRIVRGPHAPSPRTL